MIARKIVKQFPLGCGIRITFKMTTTGPSRVLFEIRDRLFNRWLTLANTDADDMLDYYPKNIDTIIDWYTKYRDLK